MDVQPGRSEIDPVLGIHLLREGLRGPRSRGAEAGSGVTVPALVDVPSGKVATNASTRGSWTGAIRRRLPQPFPLQPQQTGGDAALRDHAPRP
mgnify:CR=1 FL=1